MKITHLFAAALLALPCVAQDAISQADAQFYRAFYLERAERDFEGALTAYQAFVKANPEHAHAKKAAQGIVGLLGRLGRGEEASKMRKGDLAQYFAADAAGVKPASAEAKAKEVAEAGAGERPARGNRGQGNRGQGNRGQGQRGNRGQGGAGGGRRGGMGRLFNTKLVDMDDGEMAQFVEGLDRMGRMTQRMRDNGMAERADQLEASVKKIKEAIEGGKLEEAQKVLDELAASFRRR